MNHSKLVEEARELADSSWHGDRTPCRVMLRTLADIVEKQDARLAQLADANINWANAWNVTEAINVRLAAVCKACDETIGAAFSEGFADDTRTKLRAAGYQARDAGKLVKSAKPVADEGEPDESQQAG